MAEGKRLEGKVALVTGAGRGIGRAAALRLAAEGASVIAVSRTKEDLDSLIEEGGGGFTAWEEDVTKDAFNQRMESLDGLDILFNNAGTNKPMFIEQVSDDVLDLMLDLNVRAMFKAAQSAARVMKRSGGGVIVNMSSQMGHVGSPRRTVYCMTKHAVEGLTRALAIELAEEKIRVNSIAATFLDTPMTRPMFQDPAFKQFVMDRIPMKQLGSVDDVAEALVFLCTDASRMVTGHSLLVDGGWTAQ